MAQHKYDLLLVSTLKEGKKKYQPWYRERLQNKYVNPRDTKGNSGTLIGRSWKFIEPGLDDFRDGLPKNVVDYVQKNDAKGVEPTIVGSDEKQMVNEGPRFTKYEAVYAKSLPMQQQRRDHVEDLEYNLIQHPLALFPHLEESVPPDVFEDVVDVLDPEMHLGSEMDEEPDDDYDNEETQDDLLQSKTSASRFENQSRHTETSSRASATSLGSEFRGKKNPYTWLPRPEDIAREEKKKSKHKRSESPSLDAKIQNVTKEFCQWVSDLGGETNNIEESTVMSLFASGYETKPALSVPIHVVELTNVPPELRMNAGSPSPKQDSRQLPPSRQESSGPYHPSWVKVKYGAWYLDPNTWKARPENEQLQDPKEHQDKQLSESKKKSQQMDSVLATIHGAKAFKNYLSRKQTRRMPEFLDNVVDQPENAGELDMKNVKMDKKKPQSAMVSVTTSGPS